jgi:hypothetical protein
VNTYRIALDGMKFQVIETLPNGAACFVGGFETPDDARVWIDNYLQMIGQPKAMLIDETQGRL